MTPRNAHRDEESSRLDRLTAHVRPEFLADVIEPDPDGVYSYPPCQVPLCGRASAHSRGAFCKTHLRTWIEDGRPDETAWLQTADPKPLGFFATNVERSDQRDTHCHVPGCAGATQEHLLCKAHLRSAKRLRTATGAHVANRALLAWFVEQRTSSYATARGALVLTPLSGLVRFEVALGLQNRGTSVAPGPVRALHFNRLVALLAKSRHRSLLPWAHEPEEFLTDAGFAGSDYGTARAFLRQTAAMLAELLDLPQRRSLGPGIGGSGVFMDARNFRTDWLRPLVARWAAYRSAAELCAPDHLQHQVRALRLFDDYLVSEGISTPEELTREALIRYALMVRQLPTKAGGKRSAASLRLLIGTPNRFLQDVRELEWAPRLRAGARLMPGELPRRPPSAPRFISEFVMRQLESERALALIKRDDIRTMILIMMNAGLRMHHTLQLETSCLDAVPMSTGIEAYSLSYNDTKSGQHVRVPIPNEVAAAIQAQQTAVRTRFGSSKLLFPRMSGRQDSARPVTSQAVYDALRQWCLDLGLRDENGEPVRVTSHQFRHTSATRWINNDVPAPIVQRLLGHKSPAYVQVYARLHDATIRKHWEKARVNISGELVKSEDEDAADLEWMVTHVNRASQAVPHGWCTLPPRRACPHANACFDCEAFTTGPEFLGDLKAQLKRHEQLAVRAERAGETRKVELNRRPADNLRRIVEKLESLGDA